MTRSSRSKAELGETEEEVEEQPSDASEEENESKKEASEDESDDSDNGEEESDGDEDESGSESEERPRRSRKPFIPPPPRSLPQRTTRGQRQGVVTVVQDDQADEEFWNQEFFAEEERDERYETESEPEDRFDADFMESEDEDQVDSEEEEANARAREPKKKTLKPPGYRRPAPNKPAAAKGDEEAKPPPAKKPRAEKVVEIPAERSMAVRQSTRQKVDQADEERRIQEALKPRRISRPIVHHQLTQAELLAEAARTEIENTRSLQYLVMVEEETRKKATVKKGRYVGPMVRLRSSKSDKDEEQTTIEVRNMQTPDWLKVQKPPQPVQKAVCVITGKPARYRDPHTGLAYHDMEAYKELMTRRSGGVGIHSVAGG